MRALITATANITGRIVGAIMGGSITVVTAGTVVTTGGGSNAVTTGGGGSNIGPSANIGPGTALTTVCSKEGDVPRSDPKKVLH